MAKILLDGRNVLILWFGSSKCLFFAFFWVHQKLQLWLNILTAKWHFLVQTKVALLIKNSKDSKNGSKSYHIPLNNLVPGNPPKNMWYRYFKIGPWKFCKMYLKLILSMSPIMCNSNFSRKLTLTLYWTVLVQSGCTFTVLCLYCTVLYL